MSAKGNIKENRISSEIKDKVDEPLQTHHVFLDTEVYFKYQFYHDNPVLKTIIDLIKQDKLVLHITDITLKEIERHISAAVKKSAKSLNKSIDDYALWHDRVKSKPIANTSADTVDKMAARCFEKFKSEFGFEYSQNVISATGSVATTVFRNYFERKPPFDFEDSKEFPDAFAIEALDAYCRKYKLQMNVVSGDKAFIRAVSNCKKLIGFKSVGDLTALFANNENPGLLKYVQKFLGADVDMVQLQAKLDGALDTSSFYYMGDYRDGELDEVSINGDIEMKDYQVLSHGDSLNLILQIIAPLSFDISYEDVSDAIYDKEDGVYFGAENEQTQFDCKVMLKVYVKFNDDTGNIEDLEVVGSAVHVREERDWYD